MSARSDWHARGRQHRGGMNHGTLRVASSCTSGNVFIGNLGVRRLGVSGNFRTLRGSGVGFAKNRQRRATPPRVRRYALETVSAIPFLLLGVATASAQPTGASVVAGQARISSSGATTTINQATSKAIINWQSFSVGQGSTVQFNQPNSSAITLNRVTGTSASTID